MQGSQICPELAPEDSKHPASTVGTWLALPGKEQRNLAYCIKSTVT